MNGWFSMVKSPPVNLTPEQLRRLAQVARLHGIGLDQALEIAIVLLYASLGKRTLPSLAAKPGRPRPAGPVSVQDILRRKGVSP